MKATQVLSLGVVLSVAAAQSFESLPDCGKLCVNNMLAKAKELGCATGDAACLCRNIDFAYGIRDCSFDVCGPLQSAPVVSYGESYCKNAASGGANASSTISGPVISSSSSSTLPATTLTSMTGKGSAIATSALVSLVTHGTEVFTSTFSLTTIYSSEPTPIPSQSQNSMSTSINPSYDPAPTSSETSSSSEGSGAKPTAFAGLAAVAGLAAMIL